MKQTNSFVPVMLSVIGNGCWMSAKLFAAFDCEIVVLAKICPDGLDLAVTTWLGSNESWTRFLLFVAWIKNTLSAGRGVKACWTSWRSLVRVSVFWLSAITSVVTTRLLCWIEIPFTSRARPGSKSPNSKLGNVRTPMLVINWLSPSTVIDFSGVSTVLPIDAIVSSPNSFSGISISLKVSLREFSSSTSRESNRRSIPVRTWLVAGALTVRSKFGIPWVIGFGFWVSVPSLFRVAVKIPRP